VVFWAISGRSNVVASILDGDNVLVNGVPYEGGVIDLDAGAVITTVGRRAGSFISASGQSVVLGPDSELVVKSRDEANDCLELALVKGRAWILIDEGEGRAAGVDIEYENGEQAVTSGAAFVHVEPDHAIRIARASCDGKAGDENSSDCPRLEMARLDEIVVELVPTVSSKTAERARSHYDRVKPAPVHWVKDLGHAEIIAASLKRPILVVSDDSALPDEAFRSEESLRRAAVRYVCVRVDRGADETRRFLANVDPPDNRSLPRLLLCPERKFRAGFGADASIADLVAEMNAQCDEITEFWRKTGW
jgi:hypothetical protein